MMTGSHHVQVTGRIDPAKTATTTAARGDILAASWPRTIPVSIAGPKGHKRGGREPRTGTERALQKLARESSRHRFRAEKLGVQCSSPHRSYWEPWRSKLVMSSFVLGVLVFKALYVIFRTGSLGVQSSLRHRSCWDPWRSKLSTSSFEMEPWCSELLASLGRLGAGTLASKLCPSLGRL